MLRRAAQRTHGATVFGYWVRDPERYGVAEFDARWKSIRARGKAGAAEVQLRGHRPVLLRPARLRFRRSRCKPSPRGELEITDLNRRYLEDSSLMLEKLGRGYAWLDTGTHESLTEASNYIETIENRQGLKVCCPEEIAFVNGWIDAEQVLRLAQPLAKNGYGQYLQQLVKQGPIA